MRQPINLELRALKTPRERVWEALLKTPAPFTRTTVQDRCEPMVRFTAVHDYFTDLEAAGYLCRVNTSAKPTMVGDIFEYELTQRPGAAPRVTSTGAKVTQGIGTEAMWRVMKILPTFDYRDIAAAASLGDFVVSLQTAKSYVLHLARAGYLSTVQPSKPGTPARHRLERNTGMHAPSITRLKVVFDRNTGTFANLQTPQEVCDGLE